MKNIKLIRILILYIAIPLLLFSCSSDDDNDTGSSSDFVELPTSDLGVYEGVVISNSINEGGILATLSNSGDRIYDINFNIDVSPITDIQFIVAPEPNPNNLFTTTENDLNSRGLAVNLIDIENGIRTLTVTMEVDGSSFVFTGEKQ